MTKINFTAILIMVTLSASCAISNKDKNTTKHNPIENKNNVVNLIDSIKLKVKENDLDGLIEQCVELPLVVRGDLDQDPSKEIVDTQEVRNELALFLSQIVYNKNREGLLISIKRDYLIEESDYPKFDKNEIITEFIWCDILIKWNPVKGKFMVKGIYPN